MIAVPLPKNIQMLALTCSALSVIVLAEYFCPQSNSAEISSTAPIVSTAAPVSAPGFSLEPLNSYAEVVQRPLFSPSRRGNASDASDDAAQAEDMSLAGIIISGKQQIALIRHGQSPAKISRVQLGQDFNGWTVRSISTDRITLDKAGENTALTLRKKPATP